MVQNFNSIVSAICERIAEDVKQGRNMDMLLGAFNEWQEDEQDGACYIFDINNTNDLKYLVKNDMITASGIAWAVGNCDNGIFQFNGSDTDAGIHPLSIETLKQYLTNNAVDYIPYVILYAARCGKDSAYAQVYEEYVTQVLENSRFNPKHY